MKYVGDECKIQAILDWEWAIAGEPTFDLTDFDKETLADDEASVASFYEAYGVDPSAEQFQIRRRVYTITQELSSAAYGYIYHNPSAKGFKHVENELRKAVRG